MVPFEEDMAIMPKGGVFIEFGALYTTVLILFRGKGKIRELYSRIRG